MVHFLFGRGIVHGLLLGLDFKKTNIGLVRKMSFSTNRLLKLGLDPLHAVERFKQL